MISKRFKALYDLLQYLLTLRYSKLTYLSMIKVGELLKVLNAMGQTKNLARTAFENYLLAFFEPNSAVDTNLFESFFRKALSFSHWQQNKAELGHEFILLKNKLIEYDLLPEGLLKINGPQDFQIVEIESLPNWNQLTLNFLKQKYPSESKIKLIYDDRSNSILGLVLVDGQNFHACQFSRQFAIYQGELQPLDLNVLRYSSDLNLTPENHIFDIGSHCFGRISRAGNELRLQAIHGFQFEIIADLLAESISDHGQIFFALKRIEQFFVDRRTDSYYQGICQKLEFATKDIQMLVPDSVKKAFIALEEAEIALEKVFIGDKFLSLLIRDLRSFIDKSYLNQGASSWPLKTINPKQPNLLKQ